MQTLTFQGQFFLCLNQLLKLTLFAGETISIIEKELIVFLYITGYISFKTNTQC